MDLHRDHVGGYIAAMTPPPADNGSNSPGSQDAWALLRCAAAGIGLGMDLDRSARYTLTDGADLVETALDARDAPLAWHPGEGWRCLLPADDPRRELIDLYLPICGAHAARPIAIGHLGQSLDGFIATHDGESNFVTGPANILHLHRMRALCDAVIVGAGTVASDDPQLTTRLVSGSNPLRVIIDPECRLDVTHGVFQDRQARTLRICGRGAGSGGARANPQEEILELDSAGQALDLAELVTRLHARGLHRLFVEGGGVTVSAFLQAGLLDRLQIAVAALLIGSGRPGIRLAASASLGNCLRPLTRVYRMGHDVLYDCDLRQSAAVAPASQRDELQRVF